MENQLNNARRGCVKSCINGLNVEKLRTIVNGGLKVSNSSGIKLSTCQSLGLKTRGHVDDRCGGVPHVARFIQQRFEHQRDRQANWTQPGDGTEVSEFAGPSFDP